VRARRLEGGDVLFLFPFLVGPNFPSSKISQVMIQLSQVRIAT
jgi:hypothetical protein